MHITNKQFALILKENSEDINNVVHLLQTSIKVLKKYGQNVFAKEYMEAITHVDKDLGKILISLNHAWKIKITNITSILRLVKENNKNYKHQYTIHSPKNTDTKRIESFIHDKDKEQSIIEQENTQSTEVIIKGEWNYYKRSAIAEAEKLLQ